MELSGIRFVGFNEENGQKVLLTILFVGLVFFCRWIIRKALYKLPSFHQSRKLRFWARQGLNLTSSFIILLTFLSIWFDDPTRLATGLGLVTAGLAFALQKVVTSFAGYLVIMRGNTFSIGERITMGGIRGDVIYLGFLQTTIMEMGQPPSVQAAAPAIWVGGRQFTGRIVTVTNDKIFETPVYNYTRDFPFIWEEIAIPVKYGRDRFRAEEILLKVVSLLTESTRKKSIPLLKNLETKYGIKGDDILPKSYYRLTDNWVEISVRFIVEEHGVRELKDRIFRQILDEFDSEEIEIASTTVELVGVPKLRFEEIRTNHS